MKYSKSILPLILSSAFVAVLHSNANASDAAYGESLKSDMKICASKKSDSERLECFDKLALIMLSVKQPQKEIISVAPAEKLGDGDGFKKKAKRVEKRGLVTACKKSGDGKWFFIFESGQIWKQIKPDSRRYKNCNFSVTIKEDGFGYKMQIDGQKRKIRIKRHK